MGVSAGNEGSKRTAWVEMADVGEWGGQGLGEDSHVRFHPQLRLGDLVS